MSAASNYVLWISEGVEIRLVDGLVLCRTLTAENLICVTITIVYCQNRIAVTFLLSFFCFICFNHTLNNTLFMLNPDGRKKLT